MKFCGARNCPVCVLNYTEAKKLPQDKLAAGILWHLAGTGEGLEALSWEGRLIVEADGGRRQMERRPYSGPCAI